MEKSNQKQISVGFVIFLSFTIFLIFLGLNIFSSHTGNFIEIANTSILPVVLLFASIAAWQYRGKSSDRKDEIQVGSFFGIGLALYAFGEITWLIYLFAGVEPPYPGLPDFFWISSYPFLIFSLLKKYKLLGIHPPKNKLAILWIILTGVLAVTLVFVVYPIVSSPDAASIMETFVNLYYPLADLVYISVALLLIFAFWGGKISSPWVLIGLSAIVLALSDIVFIYADWNGLYYPGNQINIISELADMGYLAFALLAAVGVYIQGRVTKVSEELVKNYLGTSQVQQPIISTNASDSTSKAGGVIFSDKKDQLIYINDYLRDLIIKFGGTPPTAGKPIREILGVDESTFGILRDEIIRNAVARRNLEININSRQIPFSILASGRIDQKGEYDGSDMFLTLVEEGLNAQDQEELKLADTGNHLLREVWSKISKMGQLGLHEQRILTYLIVKFTTLYIFIARMAGISAAQHLSEIFNLSAKNADIAISMKDGSAVFEAPPEINKMRFILEEMILYSQNLVSKESVAVFQNFFNQTIPPDILEAVKTDSPNP